MPEQDQAHRHGHTGQCEARSHGETHHELRRVNLNTASRQQIEDLPMVGPKRAEALIRARLLRGWEDVVNIEGMDLGIIDDLKSGGAELG
jgi:DNA uptake protein ComE-like DNA-binding protein